MSGKISRKLITQKAAVKGRNITVAIIVDPMGAGGRTADEEVAEHEINFGDWRSETGYTSGFV